MSFFPSLTLIILSRYIISITAIIADFEFTPNKITTKSLFRSCVAGIYQNKLIVFAGYSDGKVNNDRYEFDLSSITADTTTLPELHSTSSYQSCPETRTSCDSYGLFPGGVSGTAFDDKLYFGSIGSVTSSLTIYDLSTVSYVPLSSYQYTAPTTLNDHCATASSYNNKLYLFGYSGSDSSDDPGTTIIYDITKDNWSYGANMTQPLWQTGCSTNLNGDIIYTFGGRTTIDNVYRDLIQQYNINNDSWIKLSSPSLITAREGLHCVTNPFEDEIICMGGRNGKSNVNNLETAEVFEIYDMNIYQIALKSNYLGSIAETVWIHPTDNFGYIFLVNSDGIQYTKIGESGTRAPTAPTTASPTPAPTYGDDMDQDTTLAISLIMSGFFGFFCIVGLCIWFCHKWCHKKTNVSSTTSQQPPTETQMVSTPDIPDGNNMSITDPKPSAPQMVANNDADPPNQSMLQQSNENAAMLQPKEEIIMIKLPDGRMVAAKVIGNVQPVQSVQQINEIEPGQTEGQSNNITIQ